MVFFPDEVPSKSKSEVSESFWVGGSRRTSVHLLSLLSVLIQSLEKGVGMERWMVMSFHMQCSRMCSEERTVINDVSKLISLVLRGWKDTRNSNVGTCRLGTGFTAQNEKFGCWRSVLVCRGLGRGRGTGQKSIQSNRMVLWNTRVGTFPTPLLLDTGAVALLHPGGICGCDRSWMITDRDFYRIFTMNFQHSFLNLVKAQIYRWSWHWAKFGFERDENSDSELWCVVKVIPDTTNIYHHWCRARPCQEDIMRRMECFQLALWRREVVGFTGLFCLNALLCSFGNQTTLRVSFEN